MMTNGYRCNATLHANWLTDIQLWAGRFLLCKHILYAKPQNTANRIMDVYTRKDSGMWKLHMHNSTLHCEQFPTQSAELVYICIEMRRSSYMYQQHFANPLWQGTL